MLLSIATVCAGLTPATLPAQETSDLAAYVIGLVAKGPAWKEGESVLNIHHNIHLDRMESAGSLLADATVEDGGNLLGVLFFRDEATLGIQDMIVSDPAVEAGFITVSLHRWYTFPGLGEEVKTRPDLRWADEQEFQLGLLKRGPHWTAEGDPETGGIQDAHVERLNLLVGSGVIVLAGPIFNGGDLTGMVVFNAGSVKDVHGMMKDDPAIASGRLVLDVLAMRIPAGIIP